MKSSISLKRTYAQGFTIVELLIVIVVIAILATITFVSYNGIQENANTTAAQVAARGIGTKAELYYTLHGAFPTYDEFKNNRLPGSTTNNSASSAARLDNPNITLGPLNKSNGTNTVWYANCPEGAIVSYFDYTVGSPTTINPNASQNKSIVVGTC